jgi:hypothetical protein
MLRVSQTNNNDTFRSVASTPMRMGGSVRMGMAWGVARGAEVAPEHVLSTRDFKTSWPVKS